MPELVVEAIKIVEALFHQTEILRSLNR